ncbi:toprim domain-containing protein [Mucilaginibacter paludis]|uniref:DNA primase n=1 Tax=Mucilaginibacter paludis DSM 18603 TaxID=714943 RepID=H1YI27_9SPHI|nr:toprim domain-containing protein [Mucilaginibacter paludis]EHQ25575.1 DNA primase [Mucilaginibacter paludis DSM 18603]
MDTTKQGLTLDEIRALDMVDYLATIGFEPAKPSRNGVDYYYLSPLRNEDDASFHVNRTKNKWFDHGDGKGGNLIDFGLLYFKCSIGELKGKFNGDFSIQQPSEQSLISSANFGEANNGIIIKGDRPLWSYALKNYLHERMIPVSVAELFCREVSYEIEGRSYYAIGFKNNAGGYELRNKIVKQSSAPKDITTINNGAEKVQVFEGFLDFLTYKATIQNKLAGNSDFVILNSAAFFQRARPFMEQHEAIGLWLDNDTTGNAYTKYALSLSERYRDESSFYSKYKDLNDWLTKKELSTKKQLKQKIS